MLFAVCVDTAANNEARYVFVRSSGLFLEIQAFWDTSLV